MNETKDLKPALHLPDPALQSDEEVALISNMTLSLIQSYDEERFRKTIQTIMQNEELTADEKDAKIQSISESINTLYNTHMKILAKVEMMKDVIQEAEGYRNEDEEINAAIERVKRLLNKQS